MLMEIIQMHVYLFVIMFSSIFKWESLIYSLIDIIQWVFLKHCHKSLNLIGEYLEHWSHQVKLADTQSARGTDKPTD
jgi:hypothetical protein